ncbi:hypothetical protein NXS19_010227 [Fusarium pseudograminearum]|nr:hypothetical protein NXS19_010227 [Fusarium pseudograminearum]
MSVDLSDGEGSNPDNGVTSGADAQAKPKKKRNFKEDQYDVDDDFVDDSELLWEAQAAASRDGFFVYSGPLVPEVEKPAAGQEGPPNEDVVDEAAEEVHEVHRLGAELAPVVEVAQDPVVVPLLGSLALLNRRRHSVSARRRSARPWPKWPRHLPTVAIR